MRIQREWLEELIFRGEVSRRFTQDSPILPDVWLAYVIDPPRGGRVDLLFTAHRSLSTSELYKAISKRLDSDREGTSIGVNDKIAPNIAYTQSSVVARLTLRELLRVALPLSSWWRGIGERDAESSVETAILAATASAGGRRDVAAALHRAAADPQQSEQLRENRPPPATARTFSSSALWLVRLVGTILLAIKTAGTRDGSERDQFFDLSRDYEAIVREFTLAFRDVASLDGPDKLFPLYSVSRNRTVAPTIARSVMSVKADAARRLFEIDCSDIGWAIIDSGVDARHPAFRTVDKSGKPYAELQDPSKPNDTRFRSRVTRTFDLTRIRTLLSAESTDQDRALNAAQVKPALLEDLEAEQDALIERARELTRRIRLGRSIDWDELIPFLEIKHDADYQPPSYEHGTHVAGVLGANWCRKDWENAFPLDQKADALGVCPDVLLYDFRVLNDRGDGDEFTVMAALQLIRHLNASRERSIIHGSNLSFALKHDVANYACGRTPVCEECTRLVSSGVVVVAAAGNDGYARVSTPEGSSDGYRDISIADPGNAESVITVGATHRFAPHTYGVSYFSSRGPTGDGRVKPDLVAPGEKITAPVIGGKIGTKDGTSMAAPHVSGVAVLLMARHRELIGDPARIKSILCKTATDLGRERYFQGAGMVDALRALQSV